MSGLPTMLVLVPVTVLMAAVTTGTAGAGAFAAGEIVVNSGGFVYLFNGSGGPPIHTMSVPYPGSGSIERLRGITVDAGGDFYAYNGTLDPYVSIYDGAAWTHQPRDGWSTFDNVTYGGIAVISGYAFVTDMDMDFDNATSGLLRFDLNDFSVKQLSSGKDFIDVTAGHDGLVYGLGPGGSPGGTFVDVFSPGDTAVVRTIDLPWGLGIRGICVHQDGSLYGVAWSGTIYHFDTDGAALGSITSTDLAGVTEDLVDIDLSSEGDIIVGTRFGKIIVTDTTLNPAETRVLIAPAGDPTFVSFVGSGLTPVESTTWGRIKDLYRR